MGRKKSGQRLPKIYRGQESHMDFSEKWGRDVEEAVHLALADLQLTEDQVTITVLEEPSKGFFGIGSKLAKVRVERIVTEEEPKTEDKPEPVTEIAADIVSEPTERVETERFQEKQTERRRDRSRDRNRDRDNDRSRDRREAVNREEPAYKANIREKPENLVEIEETPALDFLKEVTDKMGLTLDIKAYQNEETLYLDINGKDSGTIIGKRGQTLDAIQYLTSLVVNKDTEKYTRVIVDAENYREKRERTLEQLANRLADKVRRTGRSVRLEPMNPYERKVIHATLQKFPGVTTRSEGEEPFRRIIIEQK